MRSSWYREQALEPVARGAIERLGAGVLDAPRWHRHRRRPHWLWLAAPLLVLLAMFGAVRVAMHLLFFFVLFRMARFARRAYRFAKSRRAIRLGQGAAAEHDAPLALASPSSAQHALASDSPLVLWVRSESATLPESARPTLDSLGEHLALVQDQLFDTPEESVERAQLARLADQDLRELIESFRRVPRGLQATRTAQGTTPVEQLVAGLAILEAEVVRLHRQLAERDLMSLATQARYLSLKYT